MTTKNILLVNRNRTTASNQAAAIQGAYPDGKFCVLEPCENILAALDETKQFHPRIIVVDLSIDGGTPIELIEKIYNLTTFELAYDKPINVVISLPAFDSRLESDFKATLATIKMLGLEYLGFLYHQAKREDVVNFCEKHNPRKSPFPKLHSLKSNLIPA